MSKRHYMDNLTPVAQNIWKTDDGLFMFSIDGFEINDPCHVSILDTDGSSYVDIPGATKNFQGLRAAVEWVYENKNSLPTVEPVCIVVKAKIGAKYRVILPVGVRGYNDIALWIEKNLNNVGVWKEEESAKGKRDEKSKIKP